MPQGKLINPYVGTIQGPPEAGLSTFGLASVGCYLSLLLLPHGVLEPGRRDGTLWHLAVCLHAWWRCWVCPSSRAPETAGPAAARRRLRTAVRGPRAGRPTAGRGCPPPRNTGGEPGQSIPQTPPRGIRGCQSPVVPRIVRARFLRNTAVARACVCVQNTNQGQEGVCVCVRVGRARGVGLPGPGRDDRQWNAEGKQTGPFRICVSRATEPVLRPLTMFTSETMSMLATSILIPTSTGGPAGEVGRRFSEWRQAGAGRGASSALTTLWMGSFHPHPSFLGTAWKNRCGHTRNAVTMRRVCRAREGRLCLGFHPPATGGSCVCACMCVSGT